MASSRTLDRLTEFLLSCEGVYKASWYDDGDSYVFVIESNSNDIYRLYSLINDMIETAIDENYRLILK